MIQVLKFNYFYAYYLFSINSIDPIGDCAKDFKYILFYRQIAECEFSTVRLIELTISMQNSINTKLLIICIAAQKSDLIFLRHFFIICRAFLSTISDYNARYELNFINAYISVFIYNTYKSI